MVANHLCLQHTNGMTVTILETPYDEQYLWHLTTEHVMWNI